MAGYAHGITREDVFTAATEIFAAGKVPTQASVRLKLGKGSFSTISKYLAEWRETGKDDVAGLVQAEEIPTEISLIFKRLYAAVVVSTDTKLNDEKIGILDKENEELRQKLEDYEVTKAELLGVKYAYQETMNRLDSALRENERVAKYLPQVEHAESLAKDNEALINQINILSEKIKVLESANLTLTLEKEKLTSNLTGANKELADLSNINQDYQVLKGRVASLEEQLEKEKQSVKQLQSQLGAKDLVMTSLGDETFYLDRHVAEAIDKHLKPKSQQSKSRKAQVKA